MTTTVWRTIGFSAAPTGWRVAYLDAGYPDGYFAAPLPGWLVQEACDEDPTTGAPIPRLAPETRVVAAGFWGEGELEPAVDACNFWLVLPPGMPTPSPADARQEHAARTRRRLGIPDPDGQ